MKTKTIESIWRKKDLRDQQLSWEGLIEKSFANMSAYLSEDPDAYYCF